MNAGGDQWKNSNNFTDAYAYIWTLIDEETKIIDFKNKIL